MTKKRKPLSNDDALAKQFVYGQPTTSESKKDNSMPEVEALPKERMIRLTADRPKSMYRQLSILAARTGKKKVEIVRELLDAALQDVES
jgi:hypothetical protein